MRRKTSTALLALLSASGLGLLAAGPAAAAGDEHMAGGKTLDCEMSFVLDGWSAAYMTAQGNGTVKCSNGKSMPVTLDAKGGGISAGAFKINDGHAKFTDVASIDDVLGDYGMAKAHAGVAKTAQGAVMTNGDVTATLGGTGDGWDLGVGFGRFTIKKAEGMASSQP